MEDYLGGNKADMFLSATAFELLANAPWYEEDEEDEEDERARAESAR